MAEKHTVVACYSLPIEAQLACGRLQAEGISAYVLGAGAPDAFAGLGGLGGRVELYVPISAYDRAAAILEDCQDEMQAREKTEGRNQRGDEPELWLCTLCGEALSDDVWVCPSCGTSRAGLKSVERQRSTDFRPAPQPAKADVQTEAPAPPPPLEPDFVLPPLATFQGDDLASRALKTAFLSVLLLPLCLISLSQAVTLLLFQGQFSPAGSFKRWLAIFINAILALAIVLIFLWCGARL